MRAYIKFMRPFTMLAPMLGVVSGALTAWGSDHSLRAGLPFGWDELLLIGIASLAAAFLNAASNGINQIYDLDIDRVNKPDRPLVTGALSLKQAGVMTVALYIICVAVTWIVVPSPQFSWSERITAPLRYHECIVFYLLAALFSIAYSAPALGRTKRMTLGANLTMAIPRGLMLKVAGWSVLASVWHWEPWFIGLIFFLFVIGASSTKDFSDMEGDRQGGCRTLPIVFGVKKAAYIIAPCFIFPWLLIPAGLYIQVDGGPLLTGDPILLWTLSGTMVLWGAYTLYLILKDPEALSRVENHPSWKNMYLMMLWAQIGFALAYTVNI